MHAVSNRTCVRAEAQNGNHQFRESFPTTTTHRTQLFLETIIDHRLCYVSSPKCFSALQILASFGKPKVKRTADLHGSIFGVSETSEQYVFLLVPLNYIRIAICDEFDRYGGSNSCSVRNDLLNGNGARYGEVSPR